MLSNFKDIITRLEKQKAAIDRALAALHEFDEGAVAESAQPRKAATKKVAKKRVLREEGRQRIADAARKRWAAKKKASKKLASAA
jgi:hypothetical protein